MDTICKRGAAPPLSLKLLTDTQLLDQLTVAVYVLLLQVCQHAAALTYHLQQAAAGMVVLRMLLQVLGQLLDARGQDCYLYLRGTGIGFVSSVCLNDRGLDFLTDDGKYTT